MIRILICTLIFSFSMNCIAAEKSPCTREDAIRAEAEAAHLRDWQSIYNSFGKYEKCDEASIAEGYSAAIGRLLASDADQLKHLFAITKTDKAFERFVIKHVDETVPTKELIKIISNSREKCPQGAADLCSKIDAAASKGWDPKL